MKKIFFLIALCSCLTTWASPSNKGGINNEILQELRASYTLSPNHIAIRNALNAAPITSLATNEENPSRFDSHFTYVVKTKGHTNQENSGRCWLFTGLNVLRAQMIDKYNLGSFKLSQNYIFFYDQLEKSNLFLQAIIDTRNLPRESREISFLLKNPLSDGGQFTGVANLVMKYGVVPASVMPETYCSNHTANMSSVLKLKLRQYALELRSYERGKSNPQITKQLELMKTKQLKTIYRILALCLGNPPTKFNYAMYDANNKLLSNKSYTPQSFYKEYLGQDLNTQYVMLMNDPSRPYYKLYEIKYDRHVYDGENWTYVNLPIDDIKQMAIASIKANQAMYFSCDVGKFLDKKLGVLDTCNFQMGALFSTTFPMNKKQRIETYASASSHAMTLIAVDIKDNKPNKWMVENSWGSDYGYKGNLIMTDSWFNEYMFRLVVNKKFASKKVLEILKTKPIMLPSWDPMFKEED